MVLSGVMDLFRAVKKALNVTFVFEAVDDPDTPVADRGARIPIAVWFLVGKVQATLPVPDEAFTQSPEAIFLGHITNATEQSLRSFSTSALDAKATLYLLVLAAPTPEWSSVYSSRQYVIPFRPTRGFNIAVSLKRKVVPPKAKAPNQPTSGSTP